MYAARAYPRCFSGKAGYTLGKWPAHNRTDMNKQICTITFNVEVFRLGKEAGVPEVDPDMHTPQ